MQINIGIYFLPEVVYSTDREHLQPIRFFTEIIFEYLTI